MDAQTQIELDAAAFRRLQKHLMEERTDVQNIDLMILAKFCRNCLSKWYLAEAQEQGVELAYEQACEKVYGMPYAQWKADPERFWMGAAGAIDWAKPPSRSLDAGKAPFDQALGAFVSHLLSIRGPCIYRKLVARRVLQVERMRSLLLRRLSERSFLLHFFASPLIY